MDPRDESGKPEAAAITAAPLAAARTERRTEAHWDVMKTVPDLPGCVAVGKTRAEVKRLIREAVQIHIGAMREDGEPIPEPGNATELIEVGQ
jgi:predicted RNase H-like HicB family nuclease